MSRLIFGLLQPLNFEKCYFITVRSRIYHSFDGKDWKFHAILVIGRALKTNSHELGSTLQCLLKGKEDLS